MVGGADTARQLVLSAYHGDKYAQGQLIGLLPGLYGGLKAARGGGGVGTEERLPITERGTFKGQPEFVDDNLRMIEQPLSGSEARVLRGKALGQQGLKELPTGGFKSKKWSEGGWDYVVRAHEKDMNAPAGSNSATGPTFRVSRKGQAVDANGQGSGWEYADDANNWYKERDLKTGNNPAANNDTHIPYKR